MDTAVSAEVLDRGATHSDLERFEAVERAFEWFARVEASCSRFDPESELRRLCARPGETIPVSPVLFEALQFAVAVASASDGALDPTVGTRLERAGFTRNYLTGQSNPADFDPAIRSSYQDVAIDEEARTVTLRRPLLLDLGAVAKGLALDLASEELDDFASFAINAGGDVIARGEDIDGVPWRIGVRHPRRLDALIDAIEVPVGTKLAVCTSGDYERISGTSHHIVDPRSHEANEEAAGEVVISVTVVAGTAMLADALATAAFVQGPTSGLELLASQGVEGLMVLASLETRATAGFARLRAQ